MLSATLPSRLRRCDQDTTENAGATIRAYVLQVSQDTVVPADTHGLVKVVVGDADVVAPHALRDMQVSRVCRGQVRFRVLAPKEIYGLDVAILLRQMREVPFECWLRRLGTRNLYPLAKRLQTLLLPKH